MVKTPDWFEEWVEYAEERDEVYNSRLRIKEDAPPEIKKEFEIFMQLETRSYYKKYSKKSGGKK